MDKHSANEYHKEHFDQYKEIEPLNQKENSPILVRHLQSNEFFVRKKYDPSLSKRLIQLKKVNHPNLPKIKEIVLQNNHLWIFEEYIHGKNLTDILKAVPALKTEEILEIGISVAEALTALHEEKLIHRDVKPGNIMITTDGVVKLIDFDALRFYDDSKNTDTVNLGTIGFASPEQFGFAQSDERSDIYSLGVVLNVCSARRYPKNGITTDPILATIITKATKLDPDDRYENMLEMTNALLQVKKASFPAVQSAQQQQDFYVRTLPIKEEAVIQQEKNSWTPLSPEMIQAAQEQPQQAASSVQQNWLRRYVPGFRTDLLANKIFACLIYALYAYLIFYENSIVTFKDWLLRALQNAFILLPLSILFTNFMNIQKKLPLIKSEDKKNRRLGFLLYIVIWLIALTCLIALFDSLHTQAFLDFFNK
ncbi:serine/threonine-protein kinase [Isobaculum melis]|uniref:non-specific serine/threonine protein kinase n=1 Tax=Isobaculum melis TaxID=142588 RepID=A0A1H9TAZ8_9LACT|nr:serine/threonine-protein kinase [Isobaculum melis]SER94490.1 Protein kinase domain-containing protein [Isobaculum melis]